MQKLTTLALIAALAAPAAALANNLGNEQDINREVVSTADPAARELFLRPVTLKQGRTHTLVTFQAPSSGNYRIVLSMKDCVDANGCKATVHAFEGTRRVYDTFTRPMR